MAKKTQREKVDIRTELDIQMNLASEIATRNPRIRALYERHPWELFLDEPYPEAFHKEYDALCKEIYGEVFPRGVFPAWIEEKLKENPNELVLRIDLNFTKDEIMYVLDKAVTSEREKYKAKHSIKFERKDIENWLTYMEIWDLRSGDPPWMKTEDRKVKVPYYLATGKEPKRGKRWTYEDIAKHFYPEAQTPKELRKAVDRIKKQYRAAYKLICGVTYNATKAQKLKDRIDSGRVCNECPERHSCTDLCPQMLDELAKYEKSQEHLPVSDLETDYSNRRVRDSRSRLPTAESQFDKMK